MTYLDDLGARIRARVPERLVPRNSEGLFAIYAMLLLAKGSAVSSQDVHDAWSAWMRIRGLEHPSIVPYGELPADIQREDEPFAEAIRAVAAEVGR